MPENKTQKNAWRIAQVFLSSNSTALGIFEVYISSDGLTVRCTCPGYEARTTCKHVDHVNKVLADNDGEYPIELTDGPDLTELDFDTMSDADFRHLIVRYGAVEVLS